MREPHDTPALIAATLDFVRSLHPTAGEALALDADTPLLAARVGGTLLDSLQLLGLVSHLETRYQVSLGLDEILPENFETATAVARLLARHLASHPG